MIVNFEQDPSAPFGTGNFRDEQGRSTYAFDPDTAGKFVSTMPGASAPSAAPGGAGPAPSAAPSTAPSPGASSAAPDTPLGKIQSFLSIGSGGGGQTPAQQVGQQSEALATSALGGAPQKAPDQRLAQNDVGVSAGQTASDANQSLMSSTAPNQSSAPPAPPSAAPAAAPSSPPAGAPSAQPAAAGAPQTPMARVQAYLNLPAGGTTPTPTNMAKVGSVQGGTESVSVAKGRPIENVAAQNNLEQQGYQGQVSALRNQAMNTEERVRSSYDDELGGLQTENDYQHQQAAKEEANQADAHKLETSLRHEMELNDKSLDPDRFMKNMSTGKEIGMIILAALNGGFGALRGAKSNDVMDILNAKINQDIDAQKMQIAGRRANLANQVDQYVKKGWDADTASRLAADKAHAAVIQMAQLAAKRDREVGAVQDNAEVLLSQLGAQRLGRQGELLSTTEDKRQKQFQQNWQDTSQTNATDAQKQLDLEAKQLDLAQKLTAQQNADQVGKIVGHAVTPEEAKDIKSSVESASTNIAKTSGLVKAIGNIIGVTGSKLDETTGKVEWANDLQGVGAWDSRVPGMPFVGGLRKAGLVQTDADRLQRARDAAIEYLATNITGATFSPEQKEHFNAMLGGLATGSEQQFKQTLEQMLGIVYAQRNGAIAGLSPEAQKLFGFNQDIARKGAQAPPLQPSPGNVGAQSPQAGSVLPENRYGRPATAPGAPAMAGVGGGNRFAPVAGVPPLVRK